MDPNVEPTQFSAIEAQKENIMPLPGGRSARTLAATFAADEYPETTNPSHVVAREAFEAELKTAAELDDPLDVYLRYIKWVTETYPSGGGSLLQTLLYKATHNFEDTPHYKNDPRYLKLWMTWIGQFSDAPRETFVFLSRKGIGNQLALYYEEFAGYLEANGRKTQAEEIYEMGVQRGARPVERLERKYGEFVARLAANPPAEGEPSSPALPVVRAALGAKFAASEPVDPQAPPSTFGAEGDVLPKKKAKLQIFSDTSPPPAIPEGGARDGKGWDSIASLAERKKENIAQPRPWAGETMKQEGAPTSRGGKLQIFRDASQPPSTAQTKAKRPERVFVALELVYPNAENTDEDEYCFEELRAKTRGLMDVDWKEARLEKEARDARRLKMERDRAREEAEDNMMMDMVGSAKVVAPVQEEEEDCEPVVVQSKTVVVALTSSPKGKIKRKPRTNASFDTTQEPTMTFHTKAANDEIYNIFNQPLNLQNDFAKPKDSSDSESSDEEEDEEEDEDAEDTVHSKQSRAESFGDDQTDMLKGAFHDDEESMGFSSVDLNKMKPALDENEHEEEDEDEQFEELEVRDHDDEDTNALNHGSRYRQLPFMTPITEQTESLPPSTIRRPRKSAMTPCRPQKQDALIEFESSPLQEVHNDENAHVGIEKKKMLVFEDKENVVVEDMKALKLQDKPVDEPLLSFEDVAVPQALKRRVAPLESKQQSSKGPIINDSQCNPMDPDLRASVWDKLSPPLSTYEGYFDNSKLKSAKTDAIRKYIKATTRTGDKTTSNMPAQPVLTLNDDASYTLRRELGKGAFAPVYLIENNLVDEDEEVGQEEMSGDVVTNRRTHLEALKMETPPTAWEFYITRIAHRRLGVNRATSSIVRAHEFHLYRDEAFLILDYHAQGTILDLVNLTATPNGSLSTPSGTFEEVLVIFLTIELLRTVEAMHTKDILHGDLKADNCLLRLQTVPDSQWSARYARNGSNGWSAKGLVLIDLGRGIDMRLFRKDVSFIADWKTDNQDCPEMREMRPWTYQVDYYGIAAVVHSMLFGKYIETTTVGSGLGERQYKLVNGFKRYWQQELWGELFDVLLNPGKFEGGVMPTGTLRGCREKMEEWLEVNCERGVGLKGLLRKIEEGVKRGKR